MSVWCVYRVTDDTVYPGFRVEREELQGTYDTLEEARRVGNELGGELVRIREMPERRARGYRMRRSG